MRSASRHRGDVMRALFGTDGSDASSRALGHGRRLLEPDAEVTVACVAPVPEPAAGAALAGFATAMLGEGVVTEARQWATAAAASTVAALGTPASALVRFGSPGPVLCQLAVEGDFDVLVVGSRRAGLLDRALAGSVSRYVVQHASCPVLVVGV